MEFNEEQRTAFLNDIPFYENNDCYCLGNSLEEAGKIVQKIVESESHSQKKNVRPVHLAMGKDK